MAAQRTPFSPVQPFGTWTPSSGRGSYDVRSRYPLPSPVNTSDAHRGGGQMGCPNALRLYDAPEATKELRKMLAECSINDYHWDAEPDKFHDLVKDKLYGFDLAAAVKESYQAKLKRVKREIPNHLRLGGLGSYDRHVTHVSFSPDSRLLAVADLAGYVDTWTLGSDASQQNGHANGAAETSEESSDSDSSSDEESDSNSNNEEKNKKRKKKHKTKVIRLIPNDQDISSDEEEAKTPKKKSKPTKVPESQPGKVSENINRFLEIITSCCIIFVWKRWISNQAQKTR